MKPLNAKSIVVCNFSHAQYILQSLHNLFSAIDYQQQA